MFTETSDKNRLTHTRFHFRPVVICCHTAISVLYVNNKHVSTFCQRSYGKVIFSFTGVCHFVRGGAWVQSYPAGPLLPLGPYRRYPSYWNAFLLTVVFSSKSRSFAEMMSVMQILPTSWRKLYVKFSGGGNRGVDEW